MPRRAFMPPARCQRCNVPPPLGETLHHRNCWVCSACLGAETPGKDATSKIAHHSIAAQCNRTKAMVLGAGGDKDDARTDDVYYRWHADASDLLQQAANNRTRAAQVALGEAVPGTPGLLKDTLTLPNFAAVDASVERTRLLMADGVDALALALDAANSAGAHSSLEKMHLHQLAVLHKTALEHINAAHYTSDVDRQEKQLRTANRLIRSFQQGLIALIRLRGGGIPIIQHVHINDGAQAVVGTVQKDIPTGTGQGRS